MAARDIISVIPQSPDLTAKHGFEFKARVDSGGTSAELFFKAPAGEAAGILAEMNERGVNAQQALRDGVEPVPNVYKFNDADGVKSRAFIEVVARHYPDALFDLPQGGADSQFLWPDNRDLNCYLDLTDFNGSPVLIVTSPLHVESIPDHQLDIIRQKEGFERVPNLPGLVSTSRVSRSAQGRTQVPLGRLMNFLGRDTVLTPMTADQAAGNEALPARPSSSNPALKEHNQQLQIAQNLVRAVFPGMVDQLDLGNLGVSLATTPQTQRSEWANKPHDAFEYGQLVGNAKSLGVIAQLPHESAAPILDVLGFSLPKDDWDAASAEEKHSLAGHVQALVELSGESADFERGTAAAKALAEYAINPGYADSQWRSMFFDEQGVARVDEFSVPTLAALSASRWDGWWSSLGVSLALASDLNLSPADPGRVLLKQYLNDPHEFIGSTIYDDLPTLLNDQLAERSHQALMALAAERILRRQGLTSALVSSDTLSAAAAHVANRTQGSESASNQGFSLDDLMGGDDYADKVERWDAENGQLEPQWVAMDDGSEVLASSDGERVLLLLDSEGGFAGRDATQFLLMGRDGGSDVFMGPQEADHYIRSGGLPEVEVTEALSSDAEQASDAPQGEPVMQQEQPVPPEPAEAEDAPQPAQQNDGLDLDGFDGEENADDLADLVRDAEVVQPETVTEAATQPVAVGFAAELLGNLRRDNQLATIDGIRKNFNPNQATVEPQEQTEATPEGEPGVVEVPVAEAGTETGNVNDTGPEPTEADVQPEAVTDGEAGTGAVSDEADASDESTAAPRDEYEEFKAFLSSLSREDVIDQDVVGRALKHRFGVEVSSEYGDLLDRANYLSSIALPRDSELERGSDSANGRAAEFLSAIDAIADRPFSADSLIELAFGRPAESAFQSGLLIALMKAGEGSRVTEQETALSDGLARVAPMIDRMKWSGQELDELIAHLPLVEASSSRALIGALTAKGDYDRLAQLGHRAILGATLGVAELVATGLDQVPDEAPSFSVAYEVSERLARTHQLGDGAAPVAISDNFLAKLVAQAHEQLGADATEFSLNTGYKKEFDVAPLMIKLNGGDASVYPMVVDFSGDSDGRFKPIARYDFEQGDLTGVTLLSGNSSSARGQDETHILWESLKSQYEYLNKNTFFSGNPAPLGEDILAREIATLEDPQFDSSVFDQDDDIELEVDFREPEDTNDVVWAGLIQDPIDPELIGYNRKGQAVYFEELHEQNGERLEYRFVEIDGELVEHTDSVVEPADALLMPASIKMGSDEYVNQLTAMLEAQFKLPDVIKGNKTYSWNQWMSLAASMSIPADRSSVAPVRGAEGQSDDWYALVEECTESALNRALSSVISNPRGRESVKVDQSVREAKQVRFAENIFAASPGRRMRTSEQRGLQQFTTPATASVALGELLRTHFELLGLDEPSVLEPTAGTAGLMVNLPRSSRVVANELSDQRHKLLAQSVYGAFDEPAKVLKGDALKQEFTAYAPDDRGFDAMICNPPFGSVETPIKMDDGFESTRLDWGIAIRGLEQLNENGVGVLIVGADSAFDSQKGQLNSSSQRALEHIQDHYNLVNAAHVELKDYKKNGAAWPLTVVFVQGRFPTPESDRIDVSAPLPQFYNTDGVCDLVNESRRLLSDAPTLDIIRDKGVKEKTDRADRRQQNKTSSRGLIADNRFRRLQSEPESNADEAIVKKPVRPDDQGPADSVTTTASNSGNVVDMSEGGESKAPVVTPETSQDRAVTTDEDGQEVDEDQSGPIRYVPRTGLGRSDLGAVVISQAMNQGVQKAFDYVEHRYGSAGNLLSYSLDMPLDRIDKTFTDYQCDGLALMFMSFDLGHEFLNQMGTGTGKGIFQAAVLRFTAVLNDRIARDEVMPESLGLPANTKQVPAMFICEKAGMFQDFLWRDVGMLGDDLRDRFYPVIINPDGKVYSANDDGTRGDLLARHRPKDYSMLMDDQSFERVVPPGKIPLVMATYSQFQNPRSYAKRDMVRGLVQGGVVLADEAHNAAGEDSNIGYYLANLKGGALAAVSCSATSIKRLAQAHAYKGIFPQDLDVEQITSASMGDPYGVLELLMSGAAQTGTMFSVSRDRGGIEFELTAPAPEMKARNVSMADRFAVALQALGEFSGELNSTIETATTYYQKSNEAAGKDLPEGSPTSLVSTNFGSLNHQLCKLFTLLMNVDQSCESAIRYIENGERPVLSMESTCEAIVKHYVAELQVANNILKTTDPEVREKLSEKAGVTVEQAQALMDNVDVQGDTFVIPREMDSRDAIHRVLERMFWVTERKSRTQSEKRNVYEIALENAERQARSDYSSDEGQSLNEMVEQAQTMAVAKLDEYTDSIRKKIDAIGPGLPLSPMDHMTQRIREAGYSCGELSGRDTYCRIKDGKTYIGKLPKRDRNAVVSAFNNIPADDPSAVNVILLTKAGASGISLHDAESNKVYGRRALIICQMSDDVNTLLQTTGRVDRAGQVSSPVTKIESTGLLFSNKAYISMMKKLAASGAGTRGDRKGAMEEMDGPDMFNSVGDAAALNLLVNNPDILQVFATAGCKSAGRLQDAVNNEGSNEDLSERAGGLAKDIVGYSSVMTQEQGARITAELEARFSEVYESLAKLGQNPLIAQDLGVVEVLDETAVHDGPTTLADGRNNAFDGTVRQVVLNYQQKVTAVGVDVIDRAILGGGRHLMDNILVQKLPKEQRAKAGKVFADTLESRKTLILSRFVRKEDIEVAVEQIQAEGFEGEINELEIRRRAVSVGLKASAPRLMQAVDTIDYLIQSLPNTFVGGVVYVPSDVDVEARVPGVILDVMPPDDESVLSSMSAWRARIAVLGEGGRWYTMGQLSSGKAMFTGQTIEALGLREFFENQESKTIDRSRVALAGPIIASLTNFEESTRHATMATAIIDGETVKLVVLPDSVEEGMLPSNMNVGLNNTTLLDRYIQHQLDGNGRVFVSNLSTDRPSEAAEANKIVIRGNDSEFALILPGKTDFKSIYTDENLVAAAHGAGFVGSRDRMQARFSWDALDDVFKTLQQNGIRFYGNSTDRDWLLEARSQVRMEQRQKDSINVSGSPFGIPMAGETPYVASETVIQNTERSFAMAATVEPVLPESPAFEPPALKDEGRAKRSNSSGIEEFDLFGAPKVVHGR